MIRQNRVLIENHQGVLGYSREEIRIKVCFGCIIIGGTNLQIMQIFTMMLKQNHITG